MTLKKMLKLGIIASSIWTIHYTTAQATLAQESSLANDNTSNSSTTDEKVSNVPDSPQSLAPSIRPREVKFNSNADFENWSEDKQPAHDINRSSVPLMSRVNGSKVVNPLANPEAKVHAVSLMNSKAADHASVGGDEFKAYAFDYWQYVDSITFWDGPIPSPDVIDTAHRNGVPVYGTLFFDWSDSIDKQEKFLDFIKEDSPNSNTFPLARQIVKMAKYYGFDGYFINQETTGELLKNKGEQMRQFMLYAKEYAQSINYPIRFAWYDAMTTYGTRYHIDGVNHYNQSFVTPNENGTVPADEFFANFRWSTRTNDDSISTMNSIGRNPYDVYAGFELQARSYNTPVRRHHLIGSNQKTKLSIGLYTPDSVLGLSPHAEDYHKNENIFWTGHNGDPTTSDDSHPVWSGISRYVIDKTALTGTTFNTSFNTGHGKKWFINGQASRQSEWNYRSVAGISPTWRWWINSNGEKLTADYDFDSAYNGGNSLVFSGNMSQGTQNDVMLYASNLDVTPTSKLSVSHKGGQQATIQIGVSTSPNYDENSFHYYTLTPSNDWSTNTFDLSQLANQKIHAIKLRVNNTQADNQFKFNLGQISISPNQDAPSAPESGQILDKRLSHAQLAEGIIHFDKVDGADYYEVYQQYGNEWQLITGSSNNTIYLSKITRPQDATGTTQPLKVVAVGKNGVRSAETIVPFEWELTTSDTTVPRPLAENVVLGATVTGSSVPQQAGSEGIESMLNGTITSNSDKWSSHARQATVDIRLTQPRTIRRWAMDHAGAGGESVNDGLMNTKDFDLYYKDENGNWQLAHSIRNNIAHVTDVELERPITAQEWRLHVLTSDNGTPWKAIRIYNWRMYETLDNESNNLPMSSAHATSLANNHVQVSFDNVPAGTTVTLYSDKEATNPLATATADRDGRLVFPVMKDTPLSSLIYYRAQMPGKELSYTLAMPYQKVQKTVQELVYTPLQKTVYKKEEALDLTGGSIRALYVDGTSEVFALTHLAITVTGFNNEQVGKQSLTIQFLDQTLSDVQNVFVSDQPMDTRKLLDVSLTKKPKVQYYVSQPLDIRKGELTLTYTDGHSEIIPLTNEQVKVTGYDSAKIGKQTLTITYTDRQIPLEINVEKEPINTQYLDQKLSEVEALLETPRFLNATKDTQEALLKVIADSKKLLADDNKTNELLNEQVTLLDKAVADLKEQPKNEEPAPSKPDTDDTNSGTNGNNTSSMSTEQPGSNNPSSNNPGSNDPGSNDPGSNDPGSNDPGSNDPGSNDPGSNDPGSNDPGSNNPGSNDKDKDKDKDKNKHKNNNTLLPETGTDSSPLSLLGYTILGALGITSFKKHKKTKQ
ncbi:MULTISPECIES: bacterial Ig-like domain-containing protein [unclassified Granulicatella]|uniref:endo-beta-N-acetylglucosaminidase n=1 Tax=unclassified Granulicatella TaxID=2630493 RepID=UPI001431913A|nr:MULTISPECIES: bacterial Ig-like domain-containing protein [unclassified Granulicatella]MBF0780284.1 bacterial Ig-like domain-containing protein [Granulicatella sp. 19428wC4_WM01]